MQSEGRGEKKIGGRKLIQSKILEMVTSVYRFMKVTVTVGDSGKVIDDNHIKNVFTKLQVCP
jgi:hypothetical protein